VFKEQSLYICRSGLLEAQYIQNEGIQKLLDMNPQAQNLRARRKMAEIKYKLAKKTKNPQFIASAWLYLKSVIAEQKVFGLMQTTLKNTYEFKTYLKVKSTQSTLLNEHYIKNDIHLIGDHKMAVKKSPLRSPSPDYITVSQFAKKQIKGLTWKVEFLKPFQPITLSCLATIYEKENPWQVVLSQRVRPL